MMTVSFRGIIIYGVLSLKPPFFNSHCVEVDALVKTVRQTCSVTLASELSPCARNNLQPKCVLSIYPFISTRQALSHWRIGAGKSQLYLFSKGPSFPWNPNVPHKESDTLSRHYHKSLKKLIWEIRCLLPDSCMRSQISYAIMFLIGLLTTSLLCAHLSGKNIILQICFQLH